MKDVKVIYHEQYVGRVSHMNLVHVLARHQFSVA